MTPQLTRRRFDMVVSRLFDLGVIGQEDLIYLHQLPFGERLDYLRARAQVAVDRSERLERLKRSVEGWT